MLLPFTTDQYQQEERRKKGGIGRDVTSVYKGKRVQVEFEKKNKSFNGVLAIRSSKRTEIYFSSQIGRLRGSVAARTGELVHHRHLPHDLRDGAQGAAIDRATICTRIPFDVVALPGARADRGTDAANGAGEEVQQQTYGNVETNLVVLRDGPLAGNLAVQAAPHIQAAAAVVEAAAKAGHPISRLCMVCRGTTVRVQRYFAVLLLLGADW